MALKVADEQADGTTSKDSDAIWADAREAVRDEVQVVRRRVLENYVFHSADEK